MVPCVAIKSLAPHFTTKFSTSESSNPAIAIEMDALSNKKAEIKSDERIKGSTSPLESPVALERSIPQDNDSVQKMLQVHHDVHDSLRIGFEETDRQCAPARYAF